MHDLKKPRYRAYLLRFWEEGGEPSVWRFSLEDPHSGERQGFVTLASLTAFLEGEVQSHENRRQRPESG